MLTLSPGSEIMDNLLFLRLKDKGGLVKPSESVVRVCENTERCIQRVLNSNGGTLPQAVGNNFVSTLCLTVLSDVAQKEIFVDLYDHMLDSTPDSNHLFSLIKCISKCYIKIRMHSLGKTFTEKFTGTKVRKQLSKLVLFKHQ